MILPIVILVVLVVIGAVVAFAMKSKSTPDDQEFLSAEEAIAAVGRESQAAARARAVKADEEAATQAREATQAEAARAEAAAAARSIDDARAVEPPAPAASVGADDEPLLIVDIGSSDDEPELESATEVAFDQRGIEAELAPAAPSSEPPSARADEAEPVAAVGRAAMPEPAEVEPDLEVGIEAEVGTEAEELRPEPMVKARLAPAVGAPVPKTAADDESVDSPENDDAVLSRFKVASDRTKPHLAATPVTDVANRGRDAQGGLTDTPDEIPSLATAAAAPETEPASETEPTAVAEPDPVTEPESETETETETELTAVSEPDVAVEVDTVEANVAEPAASTAEAIVDIDAIEGSRDEPTVEEQATTAVAADEIPEPVLLVPQPEANPVDHVLKALISRAKDRQVGIAEVAAELVEQANLEDRDIDEVLADLVDRVEDDEPIAASERLEELTLFNDSVPRRPGQLTDFDRLDKNTKKRVIIRVLCLLVAMQEDNRLTPSEPRSEAETRHWPLSRAVWPVPAQAAAEADGEGEGDDGKPQLPGRRLIPTKP